MSHWHIMKSGRINMIVLSGLFSLVSSSRHYIFHEHTASFADAQKYCREKYTDLASVHNAEDLKKLKDILYGRLNVWIGLHADTEAWRWSQPLTWWSTNPFDNPLTMPTPFGYRNWAPGEPDAGSASYRSCVAVDMKGTWSAENCATQYEFVCYRAVEDNTARFTLVTTHMTWMDAQLYCRRAYTDLALVRNATENGIIAVKSIGPKMWIGLYRDSWKWSDGSQQSFGNWTTNSPSLLYAHACAVANFGKWSNQRCDAEFSFLCYTDNAMKMQVVRLVLKKADSSVDMEELNVLEQLNQTLKHHGLSADVKLKWVKQPDGKIFRKEKKEPSYDKRRAVSHDMDREKGTKEFEKIMLVSR